MLIKIDINKAYDRVHWDDFLLATISKFGFNKTWLEIFFSYISTAHFSMVVNGSMCEFFEATNGLRQGDPLSPFLFSIMAEAMGGYFIQLVATKSMKGIKVAEGMDPIIHAQFANETILFRKETIREARTIKVALEKYATIFGQILNKEIRYIFL